MVCKTADVCLKSLEIPIEKRLLGHYMFGDKPSRDMDSGRSFLKSGKEAVK